MIGKVFRVNGKTFKFKKFWNEPNGGLCTIDVDNWSYTVPYFLIEHIMQSVEKQIHTLCKNCLHGKENIDELCGAKYNMLTENIPCFKFCDEWEPKGDNNETIK